MDKAIEKQIQQELDGFHLPRFRDIPDVGLLLEQTMRLVDSYLDPLEDVHLTSSMISNYVKHDIIARPVKKMYGREQIADLVIIAIAIRTNRECFATILFDGIGFFKDFTAI